MTAVREDEVETSDGVKVAAARGVVMATCSPINHNLAVHARQEPDRSYVVGIRIPEVRATTLMGTVPITTLNKKIIPWLSTGLGAPGPR